MHVYRDSGIEGLGYKGILVYMISSIKGFRCIKGCKESGPQDSGIQGFKYTRYTGVQIYRNLVIQGIRVYRDLGIK